MQVAAEVVSVLHKLSRIQVAADVASNSADGQQITSYGYHCIKYMTA